MSPRRRTLTLIAGAILGLSRATAYGLVTRPVQEPLLLGTADGRLLGAYACLWGIAGLACLWHIARPGRAPWGMWWLTGLTAGWAAMWTLGGIATAWPLWWQTATLYTGLAIVLACVIPRPTKEVTP